MIVPEVAPRLAWAPDGEQLAVAAVGGAGARIEPHVADFAPDGDAIKNKLLAVVAAFACAVAAEPGFKGELRQIKCIGVAESGVGIGVAKIQSRLIFYQRHDTGNIAVIGCANRIGRAHSIAVLG